MKNLMFRVGAVSAAVAAYGVPAFAVSDADGLIPVVDFIALSANASSVAGQAMPVALLVAGIPLGLGAIVWIVSLLRTAFRSRFAKS